MNDVGVINRFLDTFNAYIDSGFGMLGSPILLKSLSRRTYTTITNLSVRSKPTDRPGTTTL